MSTPDHARGDSGLRVHMEQQGPAAVVRAWGEIDLESANVLEIAIRSALGSDAEALLLDLGEVSFIDSTGLDVLLAATTGSSARGHRLRIARLSPNVQREIEVAGLKGAFPVVDCFVSSGEIAPGSLSAP